MEDIGAARTSKVRVRGRRATPARSAALAAGALMGAVAIAVGVAACTGSGAKAQSTPDSTTSPAAVGAATAGPASALQAQYESVISKVLPSIVEIRTNAGLGSGVVFDSSGDIVTNDHVVGNSHSFKVRFSNSATSVSASLVGTFSPDDLAVIKVSGSGASKVRPASFGDSAQVKVGEVVLAMGNPLGLASSVTNGIVSAVGRTLTEPRTPDSPGATLPNSIQTSAAINPGNSGGALVDLNGQVIGIPTLAATDRQLGGGAAPGIGFAIPSNTVTAIARQLIQHGKVTNSGRAALGVRVATVTGPAGSPVGAGVASVVAGGGAAKAGIQPGDVIVKVSGTKVRSAAQLAAALTNFDVGQQVAVTVRRNGSEQTVHVTLGQLH